MRSTFLSITVTPMPCASRTWSTTCPNRPKPIDEDAARQLRRATGEVVGLGLRRAGAALARAMSSAFAAIGPSSMVSAASAVTKLRRPRRQETEAACERQEHEGELAGGREERGAAQTASRQRRAEDAEQDGDDRKPCRRSPPASQRRARANRARARAPPSIDMPTLMKKRPSSMPRNGSISASSWWRKFDSARSTPARNAPIAIESPAFCMTSAAPSTTSSARGGHHLAGAARGEEAEERVEAVAPDEHDRRRARRAPSRCRSARRGWRRCSAEHAGRREERQQREDRHDREVLEQQHREGALAVGRLQVAALLEHLQGDRRRRQGERDADDDRGAAPDEPEQRPRRRRGPAPSRPSCARPRPKMSRRIETGATGLSSSPTMKSSSTTPSSATLADGLGLRDQRKPDGPMTMPAAR